MSTLPIAEIFTSVQGEGRWTGTPMTFVRLAGCNVGQYMAEGLLSIGEADYPLYGEKKHSVCTAFDGQKFLCDTNYHAMERLTVEQILQRVQAEHVCVTGGEPFLHDWMQLAIALGVAGKRVHVETSGTWPLPDWARSLKLHYYHFWITCCPKAECVLTGKEVSEWKVLVGPDFNEEVLNNEKFDEPLDNRYLQPINGVHDVWKENLAHCLELLKKHPDWKLSAQLHKYLEVR